MRPAADGSAKVEITRERISATVSKFDFLQVELKGKVTAGETWTLQLTNVTVPAVARYTTQFGDTLSDIAAGVCSGTHPVDGMIVAPCSMGTLSRISHGNSGNVIERAAILSQNS